MDMIRHETARQESYRHPVTGRPQQTDEGLIVSVRMKGLGLAIATIDDVVTILSDGDPRRAWHNPR
ncbi:hypothetical protein [Nitrospira lenta]|uniref:hypothetical protein n=1 Tax=Nitrospira lenta TaxID=1436998 RepID=UPI000EFD0630|nr:hypothetical protein [Nitrospira lenta]